MGYRSDVKYVISFETNDKRDAFVAVSKMKATDAEKEAITDWDLKYCGDMIRFSGDNWKWYEGDFPVVDAHNNLLEEAVQMGGSYRFIRVGENYDDVEDRYDGDNVPWDAIDFVRAVEFC
jgi:hypothetical protein